MTNLNALPTEIIREIIVRLPKNGTDPHQCTLANRKLSDVAMPELYKHVDLSVESRGNKEINAKSTRRQARLLHSLAENPKLGALVKRFKITTLPKPLILLVEESDLRLAAKNMVNLTKASLTLSPITTYILANLNSYSQLTDLEVIGMRPEDNIWSPAPTSLTSLQWTALEDWDSGEGPFDTVSFLLLVAETTCPALESLYISISNRFPVRYTTSSLTAPSSHFAQSPKSGLPNLKHFGFHWPDNPDSYKTEDDVLKVLRRYRKSLKSVSVDASCHHYCSDALPFLLKVGKTIPLLTSLALTETRLTGPPLHTNPEFDDEGDERMTGRAFLESLIQGFVDLGIELERFSVPWLGDSFSGDMGQVFGKWKRLRWLRVGDIDNSGTPYDAPNGLYGRRMDFKKYQPAFLFSLPPTIQEVYLEINGEKLGIMNPSEFDPISSLSLSIFTTLRQLHTLDIHAWIGNLDDTIGPIPEHAVFYRRLHHLPHHQDNKTKDLWVSRMDRVYQHRDPAVSLESIVIETLKEQCFEGEDAKEKWCDGITTPKLGPRRRGTGRGWQDAKKDTSWPFWDNMVLGYEMFRVKAYEY